MTEKKIDQIKNDEVDLFEVISVLLGKWKILLIASLLGASVGYFVTSSQKISSKSFSYTLKAPDLKSMAIENLFLEQIDASRLNAISIYKRNTEFLKDFYSYLIILKPKSLTIVAPPKRGEFVLVLSSTSEEVLKNALEETLMEYRSFKEAGYNILVNMRLKALKSIASQLPAERKVRGDTLTINDKIKILENIDINFNEFTPYTKSMNGPRERLLANKPLIIIISATLSFCLAVFWVLLIKSFKEWQKARRSL